MKKSRDAKSTTLSRRQVLMASFLFCMLGNTACINPQTTDLNSSAKVPPVRLVVMPAPAVDNLPEICRNAWDDNANRLMDEGCDSEQSPLTFAIYWSAVGVDFDLFVTGPDEEVARLNRVTSIGLYKTADCPERSPHGGTFESCAVNLESVKLEESQVPPGAYRLEILLESNPQGADELIPLSLGIVTPAGSKNYQLFFSRQQQRFQMLIQVPPSQ